MNILKKVGLTALGTSLVVSSAVAGELSVSGSAGYTYSTEDNTGNGEAIGYNHHITFSGSGDLDNGWSVATSMTIEPSAALSASYVSLTMGSMGTVIVGNGYGGIGQAFDAVTPKAYEENHDGMSTSTAIDNIGANMDNGQILYLLPSVEVGGMTVSPQFEWAPTANDAAQYDGTASSTASELDSGMGVALVASGNGLTLGAYANEIQTDSAATNKNAMAATYYANYAAGPVTIGYQFAHQNRGIVGAAALSTATKTVAAATGMFESELVGIAFQVNDDVTVSYGMLDETYDSGADTTATTYDDVEMSSDSYQISYSMGSMSLAAYHTETDNVGFDKNGGSQEITEIALNFAF